MRYWKIAVLAVCIPVFAAAQEAESLKEAVVTRRSTEGLVRAAARKFARTYAENYFATMYAHQTVRCAGEYVQMMNVCGVWASLDFNQRRSGTLVNDRNLMGLFFPVDAYSSLCLVPGTGERVEPMQVIATGMTDMEELQRGYVSSRINLGALDRKRALEIYSPLNLKMTGEYVYETESVQETGEGWRYVIRFTSVAGKNDGRTRLTGSGRLFIDERGSVRKIVAEDMIDTYSTYIYSTDGALYLVTPYRLTVEYGQSQGRTYTESVSLEVNWEKPQTVPQGARAYWIVSNEVRRPFGQRLQSCVRIVFEDPVVVGRRTARQFRGKAGNAGYRNAFCKDCNVEFWERRLGKVPGYREAVRVLTADGMPLAEQSAAAMEQMCREMAGRQGGMTAAELERMYEEQFETGRKVFRQIYGREYYE